MRRREWQHAALAHRRAATILLREGSHSAAYHLAGLAVECALKARIAKAFKASTWPERSFVQQIYNHDLSKLLAQADLEAARLAEEARDIIFQANWNAAKAWHVDSRYQEWSAAEAGQMIEAVSMRGSGVLAWIRRHW